MNSKRVSDIPSMKDSKRNSAVTSESYYAQLCVVMDTVKKETI